ncbi:MAG TPA: aquaporin [Humisphaera sp.]
MTSTRHPAVTISAEPAPPAARPRLPTAFGRTGLYACEGVLLGAFMLSACAFGTLLEHPASPARGAVPDDLARRALMGLAMGLTAVLLIYSPLGRRTGAQLNPAATLCHLRLKRISRRDAAGCVVGQFVGGAAGVELAAAAIGPWLADPRVHFVVTRPGRWGVATAWAAELAIAFALMAVVLAANRVRRLAPFSGVLAGLLVGLYITFEAPVSGMSMNPARSFASAAAAGDWSALWVYFTAPPAGMLLAVDASRLFVGRSRACGKLAHGGRCAIPCGCVARNGPGPDVAA